MPPDFIRFHGTYRYDSQRALEDALAAARALLDEEDDAQISSLDCFVRQGNVVRVDVLVPAIAEARFAAAGALETLAETAIEGAVEGRHRDQHVDWFPSGGDD